MNFLGNTNGLIDQIYYYLWVKNESFKGNKYPVGIPDTIIFNSGLPQVKFIYFLFFKDMVLHVEVA